MTETEWMACTDPAAMLKLLRARRLDPRLRRFAVECCRRTRHLIVDSTFRAAADAGEAFADDYRNQRGTIKAMASAAIHGWRRRLRYSTTAHSHRLRAADAALATCAPTDWSAAVNASREAARAANAADVDRCDPGELQYQAALLRCLFGPLLFRSVALDPSWLAWEEGTVPKVAQAFYDQRAFERLPVLADALEDAGCTSEDILAHLRGPGPHVRGCWALDLLRGET